MSPGPLIAWLPPPLPPAQPSSGPASEVGSRSRPALPPSSAEVSLTQSLEQFKEEEMFKERSWPADLFNTFKQIFKIYFTHHFWLFRWESCEIN